MNVALRMPLMTREQFLDWVEQQDAPYEFDGYKPVPMTGGTRRHARLCTSLSRAIANRLDGSAFEVLSDAGLTTIGDAVRYPDLSILPREGCLDDRVMPGVIVVFEVVSPSSGRIDRTIKLREYQAVPSMQRYVIVDSAGPAIDVFARAAGGGDWTATEALAGETLAIPEAGIELPVDEIYAGVTFD